MTVLEALTRALEHVYHEDKANAAMHCAPVKFSPITFRLAETIAGLNGGMGLAAEVISHAGKYDEDTGR